MFQGISNTLYSFCRRTHHRLEDTTLVAPQSSTFISYMGWLEACSSLPFAGALPKGRALVPGCGRGYDVINFGKNGYDSIGIDLAPTGISEAKRMLPEEPELLNGKVKAWTHEKCPTYWWFIAVLSALLLVVIRIRVDPIVEESFIIWCLQYMSAESLRLLIYRLPL